MEHLLVLCLNLRAVVGDVDQGAGDLRVSQIIQVLDVLGGLADSDIIHDVVKCDTRPGNR